MIIGIDASNIRAGGGVTHLVELLRHLEPTEIGIEKVIVWATKGTLAKLPKRDCIDPICPKTLSYGGLARFAWQGLALASAARRARCDVLFSPGGTYLGTFRPFVSISQNMLPFEYTELRRYRGRIRYLKFSLLRLLQGRTFRRSSGMIFLTDYAQREVTRRTGKLGQPTVKIAHGIGPQFSCPPRPVRQVTDCTTTDPFRLIYVSNVDAYKHNWIVAEAASRLQQEGLPITLDLLGAAYPSSLARLRKVVSALPDTDSWLNYRNEVPYADLPLHLQGADLAIFASSCENLPITLLEKMSAGLPIACSNRGPMPEVLGDLGVYFDPENADDLTRVVGDLIRSATLRQTLAEGSYAASQDYSWPRCAKQTFSFIAQIARDDHKRA